MHIRGRYQHARFVAVNASAIGSHVLYLEWRNGGMAGLKERSCGSVFGLSGCYFGQPVQYYGGLRTAHEY